MSAMTEVRTCPPTTVKISSPISMTRVKRECRARRKAKSLIRGGERWLPNWRSGRC